MLTMQLEGGGFAIGEGEGDGHVLIFEDDSHAIRLVIPFGALPWENFKRHVAADGKLPSIVIAPTIVANGDGAA